MKDGQIIKNKNQDEQLLFEGFAVIPFLSDEEVRDLLTFYNTHLEEPKEGMFASAHSPDHKFRAEINEGIKKVFKRAIDETLENCTPLGGSFITKAKGDSGILYPHQDWNIVDEETARSFNIWVPLVDVDKTNGAVCILKGSHNKIKTFRGANIPCAFHQIYSTLWSDMETLEMKAGEALIYDHRLLHASQPNHTDQLRVAAVYGVIPEGVKMKYYYKENDHIEEYECNPEFYIKGNPGAGPNGLKKSRDIVYDFPELDEGKYNKIYKAQKLKGVLEKIKSWWN